MYFSVLSRYLIKTYLSTLLLVLLVVVASLVLSNIFDLLHRIKGIHFQWNIFLQLALLKIPYLSLELLPLISMITTFAVYFILAKRNELFVMWCAGISIYRLLLPLILLNILIGVGSITILNPISTHMLAACETLESKFTARKTPYIILPTMRIMIAEKYKAENRIYMAQSVIVPQDKMLNVSIFFLDDTNNLSKRIEASEAYFEDNAITLHNASIFSPDNNKVDYKKYSIPSSLKIINLIEGVTEPDHLNLWQLPEAISNLSVAGFPTVKHQIYYYKLLFKPFSIISYVFLATCFITGHARTKNRMNQLAWGILIGIGVSLLSQIISNILAYNGIDIMLAVLLPIIVITLASNFVILHWRRD